MVEVSRLAVVDRFTPDEHEELGVGRVFSDLDDARSLAQKRVARVEACYAEFRSGCAPVPIDAPTLIAVAQAYPRGNVVRVAWRFSETRSSVTYRLELDGKAPPAPCPAEPIADGSCELALGFSTSHEVRLAYESSENPEHVASASVRTFAKPAATFVAGPKFR